MSEEEQYFEQFRGDEPDEQPILTALLLEFLESGPREIATWEHKPLEYPLERSDIPKPMLPMLSAVEISKLNAQVDRKSGWSKSITDRWIE